MARPRADSALLKTVVSEVFELIATRGVDATSVRLVAKRLGLSTGTLSYHFGNKAGLLRAALDYAYREPLDWAEHASDARRGLRRLFRRYVLTRREVRVWWRFWCAMNAYAAKDSSVAKRLRENQRALVDFFARLIASGVERGELARKLDPKREAERLVALAHGLALSQLIDPRRALADESEALLEAEIRRLA